MDLKQRRPFDLNLLAAAKRKSPQTGLLHFCHEAKEERHDTIPLLENFCYALALLRSRLVENIQEAKGLLERLLPFEVEGNFPIYVHDYPRCRRRTTGIDLLPLLHWIVADFSSVLGPELPSRLSSVMERIVQSADPSHFKLKSYTDPQNTPGSVPHSAEECIELLIAYQLAKSRGVERRDWLEAATAHWHAPLGAPFFLPMQEEGEPAPTLFDLFMGHYFGSEYSRRALLRERVHLLGALVQPFDEQSVGEEKAVPALAFSKPYLHFWGNKEQLHSLSFDSRKSEWSIEGDHLEITLPLEVPPEGEESIESAFYLNFHPDHQILINGEKGSTFQLGENVEIFSQGLLFTLKVEIVRGEGRFFGHLLRANRPQQKKRVGFEAFDWQIALRTVSRSQDCALRWTVSFKDYTD